ncbi:hypothetical protein [Rhodanobacter sp. L36]|uniref:hypothetical protein n=1 Tax=Rhodanobacter sp. L36 TaxID=1747221 RepID=UPI001C204090|nr:hypothetical protein [Rhodanobacter sp. L36]
MLQLLLQIGNGLILLLQAFGCLLAACFLFRDILLQVLDFDLMPGYALTRAERMGMRVMTMQRDWLAIRFSR